VFVGLSLKEIMKRIVLFVLTNLAVVVVLGIVASLLGVNRFLTANGLNLGALLGFALVMGFGGAIISLLISACPTPLAVAKDFCRLPL